ncbi:hypothetical protein APHAL10511_004651 [Amanita phalloides]|nr:hypothetical protein APHAL10511_004651 [Amanita phalloides]
MRLAQLPFWPYASAVAVHIVLLVFVALILPRTAVLWDPAKPTSVDKPQHPFLDALTASPASTVAWMCIGVLFVQVWWSGWVRAWYITGIVQSGGGGQEDERMHRVRLQKQRFKHLKGACIATLFASFAFHAVLVLLGAPLTNCSTPFMSGPDCPSDNLHVRTYLLALLLSLLSVPTPAYTIGISQSIVTRLFGELSIRNSLERAFVYPVIGTLVGSWIGAVPIALDWDRPWQAWPLTPAYGAFVGYSLASLVALAVTATHLLAEEHLRGQIVTKTKTQKKPKSS